MHVLKCIPQKTGPSNNPIFMGPWRFCTWWCATRGYVCSPHTSDICTDSKEFSPLGFNTRYEKIQMTSRYNSVFRNCAWLGKRMLPWFHKMFFCWEKDLCVIPFLKPYPPTTNSIRSGRSSLLSWGHLLPCVNDLPLAAPKNGQDRYWVDAFDSLAARIDNVHNVAHLLQYGICLPLLMAHLKLQTGAHIQTCIYSCIYCATFFSAYLRLKPSERELWKGKVTETEACRIHGDMCEHSWNGG